MGKTVRAEIAPDGSLAGEPASREEGLLRELYAKGAREDRAAGYGALAAFTARQAGSLGTEPGRPYSVFPMPSREFEQGRTTVNHWDGLYCALNSGALRALGPPAPAWLP